MIYVFLGYWGGQKIYHCYDPHSRNHVSCRIVFLLHIPFYSFFRLILTFKSFEFTYMILLIEMIMFLVVLVLTNVVLISLIVNPFPHTHYSPPRYPYCDCKSI